MQACDGIEESSASFEDRTDTRSYPNPHIGNHPLIGAPLRDTNEFQGWGEP
jgi:hypothetical protein